MSADKRESVASRFAEIRRRVADAAERAGRASSSVELIAVSKKQPVQAIREALAAGQELFGENYVQEAREKFAELQLDSVPCSVDLIGPLQRNKVKHAVGLFRMIQSVDRIELIAELEKRSAQIACRQQVLLQVNISEEHSKSGAASQDAVALCQVLAESPHLELRGLMMIGSYIPVEAPREKRVAEFQQLVALREALQQRFGFPLPELSMGMSHDFELAIEEGASMVRVGTALFGERQK